MLPCTWFTPDLVTTLVKLAAVGNNNRKWQRMEIRFPEQMYIAGNYNVASRNYGNFALSTRSLALARLGIRVKPSEL